MLQGVFPFGFALVPRPIPAPAGVKALAVGTLSVAGAFTVSWLLDVGVPLLRKVL